jgi:hypothetical protein
MIESARGVVSPSNDGPIDGTAAAAAAAAAAAFSLRVVRILTS